jgi:hypothetical protein
MAFLTPRYTDPIDMDYGTDFYKLVNGVGTQSDLFASIQIAIHDANTVMNRIQTGTTLNTTQIFKNAVLNGVLARDDDDGYDIYITVTNQNRDSITVTIPTLLEQQ